MKINARKILSEAHKVMTPEQIAAHALDLASLFEGLVGANIALADAVSRSEDALRKILVTVRSAANASALGRHDQVDRFLRGAAQIPIPAPTIDARAYANADWASVFDPAGVPAETLLAAADLRQRKKHD